MRKPRSFPDAETVVQDLKSVTPLIYEAADVGTEEVREFFASRGVPINVHLAPAIFRWAAKEYLLRAGRDVREELVEPGEADDGDKTDEDFRLGDLSQNGLLLTHEPYRIRILKLDPRSDAPGLPPPGNSAAKRTYYQQGMLPFPDSVEPEITWTNLIVLWAVTERYDLLGDLVLVCPMGGGKTRRSVRTYWDVPLRRPVQIIVRPVEPETGEPDRPADESASDLDDIAPNSEGAGGTDVDGNTDSTDGEDDD